MTSPTSGNWGRKRGGRSRRRTALEGPVSARRPSWLADCFSPNENKNSISNFALCFVPRPTRNDPIYIKYYMNVARTVLLGIAPFAALIFFNVKIYFRFLHTRARYSRNNNNSSQVGVVQKLT